MEAVKGWNQRHYTARDAGCTEPGLMAVTAANTYPGLKPFIEPRREAVYRQEWKQYRTRTGGNTHHGLEAVQSPD